MAPAAIAWPVRSLCWCCERIYQCQRCRRSDDGVAEQFAFGVLPGQLMEDKAEPVTMLALVV